MPDPDDDAAAVPDDDATAAVAGLAQVILDRLGHGDTGWAVTGVSWEAGSALVTATTTGGPSATIASYVALDRPALEAVVALAFSLQDEAIEHLRAAVPPCPGHPHPLTPRLDGGRAVWACPRGTGPVIAVDDPDRPPTPS